MVVLAWVRGPRRDGTEDLENLGSVIRPESRLFRVGMITARRPNIYSREVSMSFLTKSTRSPRSTTFFATMK